MSIRLWEAEVYLAQGFHPIPIKAGSKELALAKGRRATYERRPPSTQELRTWFLDDRKNVALLLGPVPHLLALNVNQKHGHDGMAALKGYTIPDTPTILTPHHGLAFLFRVPDRERYPVPFTTHTSVSNFPPNAIELRGAGCYQLFPSSHLDACTRGEGTLDPAGEYRFAEPWTISRVLADLADLPAWLRDLWITCDRTPIADRPRRGSVHQKERRTIRSSEVKPGTTVYGAFTTVHGDDDDASVWGASCLSAIIRDGESELACARFVGVPDESVEHIGRSFRCVLPGHEDTHPSATLQWDREGRLMYHDWHALHGKSWWTLPEVYMCRVLGHVPLGEDGQAALSISGPTMVTWRLRLLADAKLIDPYPIDLPPLPEDAPSSVVRVYEGFKRLIGCKWWYAPGQPTMFSRGFAAGWCDVGIFSAWQATQWLLQRQIIVLGGKYKGRPLFLPGAP